MKENVWNTYSDEDMEMIDALIQGLSLIHISLLNMYLRPEPLLVCQWMMC